MHDRIVNHLAVDLDRGKALRLGRAEGFDDLARAFDLGFARREDFVRRAHLAGMDQQLAEESDAPALLGAGAEPDVPGNLETGTAPTGASSSAAREATASRCRT